MVPMFENFLLFFKQLDDIHINILEYIDTKNEKKGKFLERINTTESPF